MSEINPSATGSNMPEQEKKKRNLTPIYILVIVFLLGTNAYMYFGKKNAENQSSAENKQIASDTARIADLTNKYNDALKNVESYKGQNAQLDSTIKVRETELNNVRASLQKARASGQLSAAEYKKQSAKLEETVKQLEAEVADLKSKLNIQIVKNDSLGKAVADEQSKNMQLSSTNKNLQGKVEIASALHASDIKATAVIIKKSGKEVVTTHSSKAEKIKVLFNVDENRVTDPGNKTVYLRVLNPDGTPLYNESTGSGSFTSAGGDNIRYTVKGDFDYSNAKKELAMYVKSSTGFTKGTYKIELYEKGFLIGKSELLLK